MSLRRYEMQKTESWRDIPNGRVDPREEHRAEESTSYLPICIDTRRDLLEGEIRRQINQGDRNTNYFHAKVNARRNKITKRILLGNSEDEWT